MLKREGGGTHVSSGRAEDGQAGVTIFPAPSEDLALEGKEFSLKLAWLDWGGGFLLKALMEDGRASGGCDARAWLCQLGGGV